MNNSRLIEANIKLLDENKFLKKDIEMLQDRINRAMMFLMTLQLNETDITTAVNILKGDEEYETEFKRTTR